MYVGSEENSETEDWWVVVGVEWGEGKEKKKRSEGGPRVQTSPL